MSDAITVMKEAYASNFQGPISELIANVEAAEAEAQGVAQGDVQQEQPQIQQQQRMNTQPMSRASEGDLVESYTPEAPGQMPMSNNTDTIISDPTSI
jgi:hypothetical protein